MLVKLFNDLCHIPSPSGQEQQVAAFIQKYLSSIYIENKLDNYGNIIAKKSGTGTPLLLTAHMDTVPGVLGADNKATIAAILHALPHATKNLEIVFTCSEESGNLGAVNLDYSQLKSKTGYAFDLGAPLATIYTSSPYYQRLEIDIFGKGAHASQPENAINSLILTADFLQSLPIGRINDHTILNFGIISGGTSVNTIPDHIRILGEIRSFSKTDLDLQTKIIKSKLTGIFKFKAILENPGFKITPSHQAIINLQNIYNKLNIKPKLAQTYGCFDANIFASHGITVITCSDGSQHNHTPKESISTRNLTLLSQVIIEIIR